jgi:hypothetical protein
MTSEAYAAAADFARKRGFSSTSAFIRAAVEAAMLNERDTAIDESEQRIAASLDRLTKELRSVRKGQQALFAFVDALVKTVLTCVPEPTGDVYAQAVARAKSRYDRFLKSVGRGMVGDSNSALAELVDHDEKEKTTPA